MPKVQSSDNFDLGEEMVNARTPKNYCLAENIINHIEKYINRGFTIEFYVGEFDFLNADIQDAEDLPPDFLDGRSHVKAKNIRTAESLAGYPILIFECVEDGEEYEIPLFEWEDRIIYTGTIGPKNGKKPNEIDVFEGIIKIAKRHNIPVDFIGGNESEGNK